MLGGSESSDGTRPKDSRWFSVKLDRDNAGWAFVKGEPFRVIASLELLGVLMAVMLFFGSPRSDPAKLGTGHAFRAWQDLGAHGQLTISGITDNQGNPFVLDKMMTTSFPLSVILMELSVQLEKAALCLDLRWTPREQNVEADALTNEEFDEFRESNRIDVKMEDLEFEVIPTLMKEAAKLDKEIMLTKEERKRNKTEQMEAAKKVKITEKMRWKEPW